MNQYDLVFMVVLAMFIVSYVFRFAWRFVRQSETTRFPVVVKYERRFAAIDMENTFQSIVSPARLPVLTRRRDFNRREWTNAYRLVRDMARNGHPKAKRFLIDIRGYI